MLTVHLDSGEAVVTETGAMMAMDPALKFETNMKGGVFGAAKRVLGGETVFLNTYTASGPEQRIDIAPSQPGDLIHLALDGTTSLTVQRGSFCASTPGVSLDAKWEGAKGFLSREGLIMLKCTGAGDLWLSSYGAVHEVYVEDGYIVDTGHVVAFEDTLTYKVTRTGGMKSLFLSGEGLVCRFQGRGRVWVQTRDASSLASFLHPFRPVQKKN